jgi:2-desacetyl-2-hydroxyethyl bacteriochlorophyllide A dehydrogenase
MKTIRLEEPGRLAAFDSAPAPALQPGEARVRVRRIGVCGTDIHAFYGRQPFFSYPRILGHELGVEVIELSEPTTTLSVGDRCAVEPYLNCGHCISCRRGRPNCCTSLKVLGVHQDGGMREEIVVPANKLHRSATLSLEQLALVETLAIGCHAVNRAQLSAGENVAVIGAGPIGLTVIQFALEAGARVIVLDVNDERLGFCRQQLGVKDVINSTRENPVEALKNLTQGDLPTAVFDATGNPKSMNGAFEFVAPSGRLVFVGLAQADISFNDPHFHRREITLFASRNAVPDDFSRIIKLIEAGRIDTQPWITHRAPLSDVPTVFPGWVQPNSGVLKAIIEV